MAPPEPTANAQGTALDVTQLTCSLQRQLAAALNPQAYGSPGLMIVLGSAPMLYLSERRPPPPAPADGQAPAPPGVTSSFRTCREVPNEDVTPRWRLIAPLPSAFHQVLLNSAEVWQALRATSALLPFYAVAACEWADLLARQMGAKSEFDVDLGKRPPDFEARLADCQQDATASATASAAATLAMQEALCPREQSESGAATLHVSLVDGAVAVRGTTKEKAELWRESFSVFSWRVAGSAAGILAAHGAADEQRRSRHGRVGEAILRAVAPRLAEAAARASQTAQCVGIRVCRSTVKGMPAEVWLFLDAVADAQQAGQDRPRVILEARRAHEEFLLENGVREVFYYPPCQLLFRMAFAPWGAAPWRLERPRVRAPQGSPQWIHPYTGPLHETRFSRAELVSAPQPEALCPMSPEGRALLPPDAPCTLLPLDSDMCLSDQDAIVEGVDCALRVAAAGGRAPDLLGAVRRLWDVARIGLTRGHQRNGRTPRAMLVADKLRYKVADRSLLTARLTQRLFPYDPHTAQL